MVKHVFSFFLFLFLLPIAVAAQNAVTGQVRDASTNEPLIGVSIVVKGNTTVGTISDMDGNFQLQTGGSSVLVFSYVGYTNKEVAVNNQKHLDVLLAEDHQTLDEVVVVGYGAQKKVNLTGSVTSLKMDETIKDRPVTSIADAMIGNVPGLTLSGNTGEPGSGYDFQIRGTSSINGGSPLILVDNVAMDISSLNPDDIESISVLKDASSAAIYGARAAFGVILITTKKSEKDKRNSFRYSTKLSFSNPQELSHRASPKVSIQALMDGNNVLALGGQSYETWMELLNQYEADPSRYPEGYAVVNDMRYQLQGTDVLRDVMETGFQQIHDFSVSGGSSKSTYRIGAGLLEQDGVLITSKDKFSRYNISSFISTDVSSWLTAQMTALYTHTSKKDPYTFKVSNGDVWAMASRAASYFPQGGIEINDKYYYFANPDFMMQRVVPAETDYDRINMLGRLILKPLKGLTVTGEYAINKSFGSSKTFDKRFDDFADPRNYQILPANNAFDTYRVQKMSTDYNSFNLFAAYNKRIQEHEFTVMAGMNTEYNYYETVTTNRQQMINPEMPSLGQASGAITTSDDFSEYAILGTFYRVNYSFKDRYLLEASGRYDGSSKFPKNNRFGFFPSFSAGWRISEEAFMKPLAGTISNLKLRLSWGSIGNQNISPYTYLPTMTSANAKWGVNEVKPLTMNTPALVRANFTWEQVRTMNAGLDFGLLNNKLTGSFDIYRRQTLDMLGPGADYPSVLGAGSPTQNAANMRTDGWELQISWRDRIGQVNYGIGFNISDALSTITKYKNETKSLSMPYYEGMKLGEIWGYVSDRLYTVDDFVEGTLQTTSLGRLTGGTLKPGVPRVQGVSPNPGDMLYKYADEDGLIWQSINTVDDPGSRRIIGNTTPRYTFGISGDVSWKGFGLSFLFQGVGKRDLWRMDNFAYPYYGGWDLAFYDHLTDYWTPEHTNSFYPRIYQASSGNTTSNTFKQSRFLYNAAYLDLRSVVLSYALPKSLINPWGIQELSLFVNGENLFSLNHMPHGAHPDSSLRGAVDMVSGGGTSYPVMRKFTVGLNLSF